MICMLFIYLLSLGSHICCLFTIVIVAESTNTTDTKRKPFSCSNWENDRGKHLLLLCVCVYIYIFIVNMCIYNILPQISAYHSWLY